MINYEQLRLNGVTSGIFAPTIPSRTLFAEAKTTSPVFFAAERLAVGAILVFRTAVNVVSAGISLPTAAAMPLVAVVSATRTTEVILWLWPQLAAEANPFAALPVRRTAIAVLGTFVAEAVGLMPSPAAHGLVGSQQDAGSPDASCAPARVRSARRDCGEE